MVLTEKLQNNLKIICIILLMEFQLIKHEANAENCTQLPYHACFNDILAYYLRLIPNQFVHQCQNNLKIICIIILLMEFQLIKHEANAENCTQLPYHAHFNDILAYYLRLIPNQFLHQCQSFAGQRTNCSMIAIGLSLFFPKDYI